MRVIVVGAGIMGLCTARSLIRRGVHVTLVDAKPRDSPARASSDHHRLIRLPYGAMTGYEAMVREAFEAWAGLWKDLGVCHYAHTGVVLIGDERSDWVSDSARALGPSECRPITDPVSLIPGLNLRKGQSAFLAPQAGILMANQILTSLNRHLGNVDFVQAKVLEVAADGRVQIEDGRSLQGDFVVMASGAWTWPGNAPAAPRSPSRQVALYLEQPEDWPDTPFILDLAQETSFYFVPGVFGTPAKMGTHTFSMLGHPDDNRRCTDAEHQALLRLRSASLSFCADWNVLESVANYYDVTPDERFVGLFDGSALWMGGFSGHGFKFAPLIGERLAELLVRSGDRAVFQDWLAGRH